MLFKGKRGTEKPIEIFVALFVILAVALLMLRLFQTQITDQQQELDEFQRESKLQNLKQEAVSHCQSQCSRASSDGCSLRSLAQLCITYGSDRIRPPDYLDLNLDGVMNMDTTLLVGVGVCEDEVPCHALMSSCCGHQINAQTCKGFLERYWAEQGNDENAIACLAQNTVRRGTCQGNVDTWFEQAGFDELVADCE